MAKLKKYQYIIIRGYIHKIPLTNTTEKRGNSLDKKDKIKKKRKRELILKLFSLS